MENQSIVPVLIGFVGGLVAYHFLGEIVIDTVKGWVDKFK